MSCDRPGTADPRGRARASSDLPRSVDFYERVLGLALIAREDSAAQLGPDDARPALTLTEIASPAIAPRGSTGLFHVAWLHPTRAALAATVRRILGAGWRFDGASDHGVSEALYLSDPDGLGSRSTPTGRASSGSAPPTGTA